MEIRTGPSPGLVSLIYWLEIGHAKFRGKYAVRLPSPHNAVAATAALPIAPRPLTGRSPADDVFP